MGEGWLAEVAYGPYGHQQQWPPGPALLVWLLMHEAGVDFRCFCTVPLTGTRYCAVAAGAAVHRGARSQHRREVARGRGRVAGCLASGVWPGVSGDGSTGTGLWQCLWQRKQMRATLCYRMEKIPFLKARFGSRIWSRDVPVFCCVLCVLCA